MSVKTTQVNSCLAAGGDQRLKWAPFVRESGLLFWSSLSWMTQSQGQLQKYPLFREPEMLIKWTFHCWEHAPQHLVWSSASGLSLKGTSFLPPQRSLGILSFLSLSLLPPYSTERTAVYRHRRARDWDFLPCYLTNSWSLLNVFRYCLNTGGKWNERNNKGKNKISHQAQS